MCYCTWNIELFEVWKCLLTIFFCPCVSNVLKNNSSMLLTFKITKAQLWKNLYFLSSIALLLNIIIFKMTDQRLIWTVFLNKLLHFRNINTIFAFFTAPQLCFSIWPFLVHTWRITFLIIKWNLKNGVSLWKRPNHHLSYRYMEMIKDSKRDKFWK